MSNVWLQFIHLKYIYMACACVRFNVAPSAATYYLIWWYIHVQKSRKTFKQLM